MQFYSQFISLGSLCFDIGANIGSRTALFRKLGASVVAVEPQDDCVEELIRRYGADSKVKILQKAVVGAYEGEIDMYISTKLNIRSTCSKEWIETAKPSKPFIWDKTVRVKMTTLDSLIAEFGLPSFCKIDIEGFEYEATKGLSQTIKVISFEYQEGSIRPALDSTKRLAELGMARFNYSVGESMELALPNWVTANEICSILENLSNETRFGDVYAAI
jgi:FkbM family methyltransferase